MARTEKEQLILDRITASLKEKGIRKKDLCAAIGLSSQTYSNWTRGYATSYIKKLPQIANFLGVSVEYLRDGKTETTPQSPKIKNSIPFSKRGMRPVVSSVSAGTGVIAADNVIAWQSVDDRFDKESCFWLRVAGDSMSPKIDNGDLVLIDKSAQIENGDVVAVTIGDEGFVKKLEITDESLSLVSYNPYYPPMIFNHNDVDKIVIHGKIVKQERDWE